MLRSEMNAERSVSTVAGSPPSGRSRVGEAMHDGVLTCARDASLADVAALMASRRVHCMQRAFDAAERALRAADGSIPAVELLLWRRELALERELTRAMLESIAHIRSRPDSKLRGGNGRTQPIFHSSTRHAHPQHGFRRRSVRRRAQPSRIPVRI